ncbi:MAG: MATE family efflux transporter, partial [Pseudomonadales bacterium]|nr:MATE family efflux transporter [Pseudomonadales bacterium]
MSEPSVMPGPPESPDTPAIAPTGRELLALVRLGAPVVAAQLAQMGMGVLDTLMAGRVGAEDLAGVALGGNVIWPAMLLLMGILMAITPTVSRLHGAGRTADIGEVMRQGAWMALVLGGVVLLLVAQAERIYVAIGADPAILPYAVRYVSLASLGLPGVMFYFLARYLCDGLGDTRPAMLVAFIALGLKGLLNWILVFGHLGAPALGGAGCGLSTAIVMWFECLAMLAIVSLPRYRRPTALFARFSWPDRQRITNLIRLGVPIGLTSFFEIAAFSMITLLVARLGADAVAAQQIAFSINGVVFMLPMGLGMAATIRIGHALGADRFDAARHSARTAMAASLGIGLVAAVLLATTRNGIVGLFTREAEVAALGARLILFVALYIVVDSLQATSIGALRGYKDTRVPMLVALLGYWIVALPVGSSLGLGWIGPGLGVYGFWIGLATGLAVVAIGLGWRLHRITLNPPRELPIAP